MIDSAVLIRNEKKLEIDVVCLLELIRRQKRI